MFHAVKFLDSYFENANYTSFYSDWLSGQDQWEGSLDDPYLFPNPVPPEMQAVSMAELAAVGMMVVIMIRFWRVWKSSGEWS